MNFTPDPRIQEIKAMSADTVVNRLGLSDLKRNGNYLIGPCPACGGHDRFSIDLRKSRWHCRHCGDGKSRDWIGLAMNARACDFKAALGILAGEANYEIPPEVKKRREDEAKKLKAKNEAYAAKQRQRAKQDAGSIWRAGRGKDIRPVIQYLTKRKLAFVDGMPLRCVPNLPYIKKINGRAQILHKGAAMVALIQGADGRGTAVHRTWLDARQPMGKAVIVHGGERQSAKLVRGSKKGGAIRLWTPEGADTLVMAEGIETTIQAMLSGFFKNAAFWAGVDLGNMSGRMKYSEGKRYSGEPDMSDKESFIPPQSLIEAGLKRLIFIQDGDSDAQMTKARCLSGLRRAKMIYPHLKVELARCPAGKDLNDLGMAS